MRGLFSRVPVRRVARWIGVLALVFGLYQGLLHATGNFHTVVAGELYRSAQPSEADLARYVRDYGIRTVVNLRGRNPGSDWYDREAKAVTALGLTQLNFRMSARQDLSQQEAEDLIALLRTAEKPILIHCRAGADRSGLAAALYVAAIDKGGEMAAELQISPLYGHLPIPLTPAYAMDRTFEALEPWLGYPNS